MAKLGMLKNMLLQAQFFAASMGYRPPKVSEEDIGSIVRSDNTSRDLYQLNADTTKFPPETFEDDAADIREHPAYLAVFKALEKAEQEVYRLPVVPLNAEQRVQSARDIVADEIRKNLRPLHKFGIEHLGAKIEQEINDTYHAQVQALRDAASSPPHMVTQVAFWVSSGSSARYA